KPVRWTEALLQGTNVSRLPAAANDRVVQRHESCGHRQAQPTTYARDENATSGHAVSLDRWNAVSALEGGDLVGVLQREGDVVQSVEQAIAAELIDAKPQRQTRSVGQLARVQIDRQLVVPVAGSLKERLDLGLAQLHRQHAVFEAVVVENVGKARRDH